MQRASFGPQDEIEVNLIELLHSDKPETEKKGALVEELLHRFYIETFDDTNEIRYYKDGIYCSGAETILLQELEFMGQDSITNHMRSEVLASIRARTYISREEFDKDANVLNLKNGLLNIQTGEFKEHNPNHYSLVQLPISYDPKASCPNIMKFLTSTLEPEQLKVIVRLLGYILLKNCKYEKAFMLCGEGSNGKSVFIKLIIAFVGKDNTCSVALQDFSGDRFASAELYNKMLNVFADLKADKIHDTGYFKTLVSGDRIRAQKKHQQPFTFANYAKLVFSANQIPESDDKSFAYYRRWVIIPFNRTFMGENSDKNLIDKLTTPEELSGLLNVALIGLKKLQEEGGFEDTDIEEIRQQYELGASKIQDFIKECCILEPENANLCVPTLDLQTALFNYCKTKGSNYVDIRQLGEKLATLQVKKERRMKKGSREYYYVGISLKEGNLPIYPINQPITLAVGENKSLEGGDVALSIGQFGNSEKEVSSN